MYTVNIMPQVAFFAAAFALAAFFRLLLIMTIPINVPTTAEPSSVRMTGMRMAHTRGGKSACRGWPASTKGCHGHPSSSSAPVKSALFNGKQHIPLTASKPCSREKWRWRPATWRIPQVVPATYKNLVSSEENLIITACLTIVVGSDDPRAGYLSSENPSVGCFQGSSPSPRWLRS